MTANLSGYGTLVYANVNITEQIYTFLERAFNVAQFKDGHKKEECLGGKESTWLLCHHGLLIEEIFFYKLLFYGSGCKPISSGPLKLSSITPTPTLAAFFEKNNMLVSCSPYHTKINHLEVVDLS